MANIGPIKRKDLIRYFNKLGWVGPLAGGKHEYIKKGTMLLTLPNPHKGDISKPLLLKILKQAGVSREEWESL